MLQTSRLANLRRGCIVVNDKRLVIISLKHWAAFLVQRLRWTKRCHSTQAPRMLMPLMFTPEAKSIDGLTRVHFYVSESGLS